MANVEAHPNIFHMADADEFHQLVRHGELIRNIFQQNAHAQWFGEGAKMLDGGHSCVKLVVVESFIWQTDVLHEKAEWNLLCNFQGTLDFIHGLDAAGAVSRSNIDW